MLQFFENLATASGAVFKRHLSSLCDIRAGDNRYGYSLDGSLVSFIRVKGGFEGLSEREQTEKQAVLDKALSSFLKEKGHEIDICFDANPDRAKHEAQVVGNSWKFGANALGIDVDDIIDGKVRVLSRFLKPERNIWAVWTSPEALTPDDYRNDLESLARRKDMVGAMWGQTLESVLPSLVNKQAPFVDAIVDALTAARVDVEKLPPKIGFAEAYGNMNPQLLDTRFEPLLVGEKGWYREEERATDEDPSGFLPPPLNEQLIAHDGDRINKQIIRIGNTLWGYLDMVVGPKLERPFLELVAKLNRESTPWRCKIKVSGGEPESLEYKKHFAYALQRTNITSLLLHKALAEVEKDRNRGISRVGFRASFATWAGAHEQDILQQRLSALHGAVSQWGSAQTATRAGDPAEGVFSSAVGLSRKMTAPVGAPRFDQAAQMLPIFQASSPFNNGCIMFRTKWGAPWPYEVGSSAYTRFFSIYAGGSGLGKSALLNSVTWAAFLSFAKDGEIDSIPYIGILDIGPSAKGMVDAIREQLPAHRKHLAAHAKLKNTREYSVNMFDTPLGLRHPLPEHKAFLMQFLGAVFISSSAAGSGSVQRLLGTLVDEVYKLRSDQKEPNDYAAGQEPIVDDTLEKYEINVPEEATWWDVVDILFEEGLTDEARYAQRYAVPIMPDVSTVIGDDRVKKLIANIKSSTGAPLSDELKFILSTEAANFEMLWGRTKFDFSGAKIVAVDLQDVVPKGNGDAIDRQAEIMYMAGRQLVASEVYTQEDDYKDVPHPYKTFHRDRVIRRRKVMSIVNYDEYQRTNGRPFVRATVTTDGREARKYNVQVSLASQFVTDFDAETMASASSIFLMGAEDEKEIDAVAELISLTEESRAAFRYDLHGPTSQGAPFLGIFKTRRGVYQQVLWHNMSPEELWMFTTTDEDRRLKELLGNKVGVTRARALLSRRFPAGSAKSEIEAIRREAALRGKVNQGDLYQKIVNDIMETAHVE